MSMPFGQPLSHHQYWCNDVYCSQFSWQASGGKIIHVLAARQLTAAPFVCYYLPSAKCIRVCCWQASTLLQGALPLSTYHIDTQYPIHPCIDSSGFIPTFMLRHPFIWHLCAFVMFVMNFVDLIIFHLCLLFALTLMFSAICYPRCCCHQHPLYWCTLCSGALSHFLPHVDAGFCSDYSLRTWGPSVNTAVSFNSLDCCCLTTLRVDRYLVVVGLAWGHGRVDLPVDPEG